MEQMKFREIPVNIEDEMKSSYMDYAMSVIIGRALPDVRDGLKPAHRRILYAMYDEGLTSGRRYSKSAGVVGEVLKKYHPHGDSAVYDTLVRMAQDWKLRYTLIDGQGNFGSIDGDPPAAYRYTEARLTKLAEEMLADIDKETVDFTPNFDNTRQEPSVLPSRLPNLLVNGSDGIAVGMATNIPPHNLGEVIDGALALIEDPDLDPKKLLSIIPGPDFPTAGIIYGTDGITKAYQTGRGILQMRGRVLIEQHPKTKKDCIVITEIPYQVNKSKLIEQIAGLVRHRHLEGVSDLRDESDRDGIRVVVELKKEADPKVIVNKLYKKTQLQESLGIIMLAIVAGKPRVLTLKETLEQFVEYRREVVTRRCVYELNQAERRAHILEGLKKAIENLDDVIKTIKSSKTPEIAKEALQKQYEFSPVQATAILDMRLQRLTGLEREKIISEYKDILKQIARLRNILGSERLIYGLVSEELREVKEKYADPRRTEIIRDTEKITTEDLIAKEDMVVTISHAGYIKRNPISIYRSQARGGRGVTGMGTREEDFVSDLFIASTHSYVLVFTNIGKAYWLKVHQIPQVGRAAKGIAIVNLINLQKGEEIASVLPVKMFEEGYSVVMATKKGIIKKTPLMAFSNPRGIGILALSIDKGDDLISVRLTDKDKYIFLATKKGKAIRFKQDQVRDMGRTARGVKAMKLGAGDEVVGMEILRPGATILTASLKGYGKRTPTEDYRITNRGGVGVKAVKITEKNGEIIGIKQVYDSDDVILITNSGKIIRLKVKSISETGRYAQGVRLIRLEKGEEVVGLARMAETEDAEEVLLEETSPPEAG